jgi:hypothetical protein
VAIKIGIDMGAIKDLVGLVTQLTDSVKDRKFASELRNIQSMIGSIQSEHAQMHEQRIKLMTENAELKQKIISLEQEILDIKLVNQYFVSVRSIDNWHAICCADVLSVSVSDNRRRIFSSSLVVLLML